MNNSLNFDVSSFEKDDFYDVTYACLNNYKGEAKFIKSLIKAKRIKKPCLVDLGCGTGNLFSNLRGVRKIGVDISKQMIEKARNKKIKNSKFILGDISKIKLPQKADVIYISTFILQTFPSLNKMNQFLRKLKLWLNSRGIILFTWIDESEYKARYSDGPFSYNLNPEWVCEGITESKHGKRHFTLKFTQTRDNSSIGSSASYLNLSKDIIKRTAERINMRVSFQKGNGLCEPYQTWAILE